MIRLFHRGENKILASRTINPKHYVDLPDEEAHKLVKMFPCLLIAEDDNVLQAKKDELEKINAMIEAKKKELMNIAKEEIIEPKTNEEEIIKEEIIEQVVPEFEVSKRGRKRK